MRFIARALTALLLGMTLGSLSGCVPTRQTSGEAQTDQSSGNRIQVGATRNIRTLRDALRIARDGDTIELDAGAYRGDVATIKQRNLTIRGVNGRPRFEANGAAEEGKAILVVKGDNLVIENIELADCRVSDRNGAGIRHEAGRLSIRNVVFSNNENGILTGGGESLELEVLDSQFIGNGHGDGYSHNIYVGHIARFLTRGSYYSRARVGHLLKSRAKTNFILYNRLTDEPGGTASYEIDLPEGGLAYVVGNLIEQSANTENSTLVAYGAEGIGKWATNQLHLSHNTFVNHRPRGCTFVATRAPSHARLVNNIFVGGNCTKSFRGTVEELNSTAIDESQFANPTTFDYRLRAGAPLVGTAIDPGRGNDFSLDPVAEYVHPASSRPLPGNSKRSPGAFQSISER